MKYLCVFFLAFLFFTGCGSKLTQTTEHTAAPSPTQSPPPAITDKPGYGLTGAIVQALPIPIPSPLPATDTSAMSYPEERRVESRNYMGTYCRITIYDYPSDAVYEEAFAMLEYLDKILSGNDEGSEVDWINMHAGVAPVKVSEPCYDLIKKALAVCEQTGGALDITLGPVVKLWNIGFPEARVPSQREIDDALTLVNYNNVILDDAERSVFLTREGMRMDLGAVAKGYAADIVAGILSRHGVRNAIVDLGGNLLLMGGNVQRGTDGIVAGIQDPYLERDKLIGVIKLTGKTIVTSGTYERFFTDPATGERYHHIFDAKTGRPAENELNGTAIVCDTSVMGDCLSTALFTMGLEAGLAFAESLPGVEALFITKDFKIYMTSGLDGQFVLQSEDYTLVDP
jgi:thiamine biosynthesis lipoprotein